MACTPTDIGPCPAAGTAIGAPVVPRPTRVGDRRLQRLDLLPGLPVGMSRGVLRQRAEPRGIIARLPEAQILAGNARDIAGWACRRPR
jgi:hypothetical protein